MCVYACSQGDVHACMHVCVHVAKMYMYVHVCMCVCINIAKEMFMKLERAREVLLDKAKRSKYDQWRSGGFKNIISFEKWLEMQNRVHTVRNAISAHYQKILY